MCKLELSWDVNNYDVCIVGETYSHQLYSEECQKADADKGLVLVEAVH